MPPMTKFHGPSVSSTIQGTLHGRVVLIHNMLHYKHDSKMQVLPETTVKYIIPASNATFETNTNFMAVVALRFRYPEIK